MRTLTWCIYENNRFSSLSLQKPAQEQRSRLLYELHDTSWNQCFYHERQARLHTVDSIDSVPQLEYTKVNLLQIYSTMIFGPLNYFKEISVQILQLNNSSKTSDFYSLFQLFLCWDRVNGKCPQFPLVIRQDISRFFPGISGLLLHAVLKYAEGLERGNAVYLPTHEEEEDLYVHTRKISITKHPKELLTRKFYLYFHSSIRPLFRDLFTVQHHTMYFQIENWITSFRPLQVLHFSRLKAGYINLFGTARDS